MRIKRAWPTLLQPVLVLLAFVVGVGSFVLVANGKPEKIAEKTPRSAKSPPAPPPSILMVGDSLSAGKFGEVLQANLKKRYHEVVAYASCGSSPEHWLRDEPDFTSKCGYRESTKERDIFLDSTPRGMRCPKLETLVAKHKPTIVVVQLGTNWMDRNLSEELMESYVHRFVLAARRGNVRQIIWITPPDSAALRKQQGRIIALIQRTAKADGVELIDSRRVTHYQVGKTGSDGIHYNSESSIAWAERIRATLDSKIGPPPPPAGKMSKFRTDDSGGAGSQ